jgi:mono/diheme cytochrome c family protein
MTKLRKVLFFSVLALLALIVGTIQLTIGWRPFLGPRKRALTNRKFEATPERVARGRYLTTGLLGCGICHTERDWTKHGAPAISGKEFAGQPLEFPGFPGHPVAPNLTSDPETGAARWTDDQIARAIREGIKHDDTTLFPMMPYMIYANLSDEDLASVVAYLRSLPAVRNPLPPMKVNFPVNLLVRGVPKPIVQPVHAPNLSDPLARGKYLVSMGCGCHDAVDKLPYGGGEKLVGPWGDVTSPNITPDPSGISYYTEATFISAMRTGYVGARELKPIMPVVEFQNLTDDDLKAMFAYLKSLPPVKHRVDNSLPPTPCKLCKQKHGAGDQN